MIPEVFRKLVHADRFDVTPVLVFLCVGFAAAAALAQPAPFEIDARWESGPANLTRSLAVGDIDGDGHLDLVCGNLAQPNTLYPGIRGFFGTSPVWSPTASNATLSVALGDIDNDGDLDLVCGNAGVNQLYENVDGFGLARWSSWSPISSFTTSSVVLGDVDGDNYLDVVCGNIGAKNTLYLNTGGGLATSPAWSSSTANTTWSVYLGDVDGDGDLDLVCGNLDQPNELYINNAGVLDTIPAWVSDSTLATTSVFLGDVTGDGNFDLVCGNYDQPNTMYPNLGGTFAAAPSWISAGSDSTLGVSLGDVDGDGDLDLVCGNEQQANVLYVNNAGSLDVVPSWTSGRISSTAGIVLADADGDGDLDLVCGNSNETNTVYVNRSEPFAAAVTWSSGPANGTLCTELGDVDGDGDLDLVCGNSGANTLYRNEAGVLGSAPAWWSDLTSLTADVALGDVDGDGDLDLICGNTAIPGEANTLYLNLGGTFDTSPAWTSSTADLTTGVALVDLNNDKRLDLVCGNAGESNQVYLNIGGVFSSTPDWYSLPSSFTTGVAYGDVDGDGDFDLAFSNSGEVNTVHKNHYSEGLQLTVYADWSSIPANISSSVALGDLDGDGDPDLVFGNVEQANTVYLKESGLFAKSPTWSSGPTNRTSSVTLVDVDGDGDLDLACGNLSQVNTLYINEAGEAGSTGPFSSNPVWSTAAANETEDVVWGDIDGDGDFDLVFGNELQNNTAHMGTKNPAYRGDPNDPANHLVNNPALLASVETYTSGVNLVRLRFYLVDVESDPVWVLPEYQFRGSTAWVTMDVGAAAGPAGPFESSPSGVEDSLEWDVSPVPFDTRDVTVRLKAIEVPARVSRIQQIPSFLKNAGRIVPIRPEITTSTDMLVFETLTLGDTASLDLAVTNTGNVDLSIDEFLLPSAEMRIGAVTPVIVPPGVSDTFGVFLEPLRETTVYGNIRISSNDPLTPTSTVSISTDIRALESTTRLLTGSEEIPLGEAATVIVEPYPDVDVEGGILFHRAAGEAGFDSIPLAPAGSDFVAVIPGAGVKETGLEYYVRVENKPVYSTNPPGAPHDSVFFQAVEKPTSITSTPRPTLEGDFFEGRSIEVEVTLPQGAGFQSGTLFAREGGKLTYQQTELALDGGIPAASIPGNIVGARGVEYWVRVATMTDTLTDPPGDPEDHPLSISVTVANLIEPSAHAGGVYRLFSIPLKMRGGILGSIADELGGTDITKWRLFGYDRKDSSYTELPDDSTSSFIRGQSYWLITRERHRIGTGPDRGDTAPTDRPFEIVLLPGHNLIGLPFDFPILWNSLLVDTLSVTDTLASTLVEPPVKWVRGRGYDYEVTELEPFDGYWVKNLAVSPVTLKIPPVEAPQAVPQPTPQRVAGARAGGVYRDGWRLDVSVSCPGAAGSRARLGVTSGAAAEWDRNDRSVPPPAPHNSMSLYFPHADWRANPGRYAYDIRGLIPRASSPQGSQAHGHIWRFDVSKNFSSEAAGDEVILEFAGIENMPVETSLCLVDRRMNVPVDLRDGRFYRFYLGRTGFAGKDQNARFVLLAGDEKFVEKHKDELLSVPGTTALYQNYPNPFNPSTIIRYQLARGGRVSLKVYDVRGALVRVLEDRVLKPGWYETGWNGENERGQRVASGVYFCRLVAAGFTETKKMVHLK